MPKGPRGEKRADAVGAAVRVARISVGDEPDDRQDEQQPAPSPAAQLGKLGGEARAKKLSRKRKSEIAKKAAAERWKR